MENLLIEYGGKSASRQFCEYSQVPIKQVGPNKQVGGVFEQIS